MTHHVVDVVRILLCRSSELLLWLSLISITFADEECKGVPYSNCQCRTGSGDVLDLFPLVDGTTTPLFSNVTGSIDNALYSYKPCVPMNVPVGSSSGPCHNVAVLRVKSVTIMWFHTLFSLTVLTLYVFNVVKFGLFVVHCGILFWKLSSQIIMGLLTLRVYKLVCRASQDDMTNIGNYEPVQFMYESDSKSLYMQYEADNRTTKVYLVCSKEEKSLTVKGETAPNSTVYTMTLHTKYACLSKHVPTETGLSVGSILLILFFVASLVYLIGGIALLRCVRGARGFEQIPNYEFWIDFPALVKDGVMFVTRGCKTETDRTYDQI